MAQGAASPALAIIGSGETSPTMVTVHKALVARLGDSPGRRAVLLDAPYAFQENVGEVTAKAQSYFGRSVGLRIDPVRDADLSRGGEASAAGLAAIRAADWVFAGPGSPSYALRQWRGSQAAQTLRDRIAAAHGVTVFASAAAAACGLYALPVYEIYKAGADPCWLDGLDLLGLFGIKVAVIPHYDNAEGQTHDTRYCYLGERRLAVLESELPAEAAVLGVDEHTALTFDLASSTAEVSGRGGVTVRKSGVSLVIPAGSQLPIADLQQLVASGTRAAAAGSGLARVIGPAGAGRQVRPDGQAVPGAKAGSGGEAGAGPDRGTPWSLPEAVSDAQRRFGEAIAAREAGPLAAAILDLEAAVHAWSTDTDQNENSEQARAVLRGLVLRLGQAAGPGLAEPADKLRPAIQPLAELRDTLRRAGSYAAADSIRAALAAAGIEVRDSPHGSSWTVS